MSPEQVLGQIGGQTDVVIADFEAGLGTVSRLKPGAVDVVLVVTQPTAKAIDVAQRGLAMIRERALGTPMLIANRIGSDEDRALIQRAFEDHTLLVPDDPAIREADTQGVAPFDAAPEAPGVRLVADFAARLPETTGR